MRATCRTTTATSGPDDSTINFDERHDNGDGRYTTVTGGTTTRHDSGKGQQGDRMHNDFDRRMMTTRGSRATGGATISSGAMMKATAARRRRQNRRCNDEGSGSTSMKLAAA